MKNVNIVTKLKREGYNIIYKKWAYWDSVPHVELDGFDFAIAEIKHRRNWQSCRIDFVYHEVQQALHVAQKNNPIILKKIKEMPGEDWFYSRYLIRNMGDYYQYKKGIYPFNRDYSRVLEKLKKELNWK